MNKIDLLVEIINNSKKIVFLGGAGVSVESGIPDFRSSNGIFTMNDYSNLEKIPVEKILSNSFFHSNTEDFYKFYKDKMLYLDAKPNMCHKGLAYLESINKLSSVITQNIDNLHYDAGSKNVYELHGSVMRNHCQKCKKFYDVNYIYNSRGVPKCECGGIIKPDVVLYEENLDSKILFNSILEISTCDTLIIGGTSLTVYPAAGLVKYFNGKNLVIINKSVSQYDSSADLVINEDIGKVFEEVLLKLLPKE